MRGSPECHIIVQLSRHTEDRARYLDINNLIIALHNDPDLSQIQTQIRPQVLQTIYVTTGCDYMSFFRGLGKVSSLTTFFKHETFIFWWKWPPWNYRNCTQGKQGWVQTWNTYNGTILLSTASWLCILQATCSCFSNPNTRSTLSQYEKGMNNTITG